MWLELLHQVHEGWKQCAHNPLANTTTGLVGTAVAILSPAHGAVDVWLDTSAKTVGVLVAVLSAVNLSLTIY